MKILDIAKEQGALIGSKELPCTNGVIVFGNEAQLLATFNAWSAQEGWKLVPIEPTKEMVTAAINTPPTYGSMPKAAEYFYKAMLSAAPLKG